MVVVVGREPLRLGSDGEIESDYVGFDNLNSCSSIDEDEPIPNKPNYAKFNEKCDMKTPF